MAEEEMKSGGPIRMAAIDNMVANMKYKSQIIARTNKLESAIMDSGVLGFMAGLIISLVFVLVPALVLGGL